MCEATDLGHRGGFGQYAERFQRRRFGQPFVRRGNMCRRDCSFAALIGSLNRRDGWNSLPLPGLRQIGLRKCLPGWTARRAAVRTHLPHHGALVPCWLRLATVGYALSPCVPMYAAENPLEKRESRSVPRRIACAWRSGSPLIYRWNRGGRRGSPENPGLAVAPAGCRTDTRDDSRECRAFPR